MASQHVRLFGHPDLVDESGETVHFRTRKHLAILVYLIIEGQRRAISRTRLAELLWPEVDHRAGLHSLSQALSVLRTVLGPHVLTKGPQPVRLVEAPRTDLDHLRAGDPIPGELADPLVDFDIIAGVEWAHWVDSARAHCTESARRALTSRLERHRERGEVRVVSECAAALYRVDPVSETAVQALAEQYLLEGRRRDAIDLINQHLQRFLEETGTESATVLELARRIKSDDNRKTVDEGSSSFKLSAPPEIIVGRDEEFAQLESHWQTTCSSGPRAVLVRGPPGIGKTTLLQEMTQRVAARAWPAFMVGCEEIGKDIPFATTSEIMHALARNAAVAGTDPEWLAEAARVTPSLRQRYPGIPEPPPAPPESIKIRVAESLVRMLDAVTDGTPVLLAIDDVHQIDPTSGEVLHLLFRRLDGRRVMLVASATGTERGGLLSFGHEQRFHTDFGWIARLNLPPMTDPEVARIVRNTAPDVPKQVSAELGEAVRIHAQGNPYLARVLVHDLMEGRPSEPTEGPTVSQIIPTTWIPSDMMHRAINRMYGGFSRDAERVLDVLAIAGAQITLEHISQTLAMDSVLVEGAALELLERAVVAARGTRLTVRNQLHGQFIYRAMDRHLRRFLHGRLASIMLNAEESGNFKHDLRCAVHMARAGETAGALSKTVAAAESAIASGAPAEAETAIRRVLDAKAPTDSPELHVLLAAALLAQGRNDEALQAARQAGQRDDLPVAARARTYVIQAEAMHRGSESRQVEVKKGAREALQAALETEDEQLAIRALQLNGEVAAEMGDYETLTHIESEAASLLGNAETELHRARARITLAFAMMNRGDHAGAEKLLNKSMSVFARSGFELERRRALNGIGICRTATGKFDDALDSLREAVEIAKRNRDAFGEMLGWGNLALLLTDLGSFDDASEAFGEAIALHNELPSRRQGPDLFSNAAALEIALGRLSDAEPLVTAAGLAAKRADCRSACFTSTLAEIDLLIARQRFDEAAEAASLRLPTDLNCLPATVSAAHVARVLLQLYGHTSQEQVSQPSLLPRNFATRLAQDLELRAAQAFYGITKLTMNESLQQITDLGLKGVSAKLERLGVFQPPLGDGDAG